VGSKGDRDPRPPLDQVFSQVGTFEMTEGGTIVPVTNTPEPGV
jgi:hypothetical protein